MLTEQSKFLPSAWQCLDDGRPSNKIAGLERQAAAAGTLVFVVVNNVVSLLHAAVVVGLQANHRGVTDKKMKSAA